jgi:hypothetical protein
MRARYQLTLRSVLSDQIESLHGIGEQIRQGWQPEHHHQVPQHIQQAVSTVMTIRLVDHQPSSMLMLLPNELMFLIFSFLPWH